VGGTDSPSLAQSLTRLQHLQRNLFRSADWEELGWLINEGAVLEEKRLSKHPILKIGPRRRLQARIEHFHGRAAIKAVALFDALESPLRRLTIRFDQSGATLDPAPVLPWNRFTLTDPDAFGAPPVARSAALLAEAAPLVRHLLDLQGRLESTPAELEEAWEHFHWHACEVGELARHPVPWHQRWAHRTESNRFLRIALEQAQSILLQLRDRYLAAASGLAPSELDSLCQF